MCCLSWVRLAGRAGSAHPQMVAMSRKTSSSRMRKLCVPKASRMSTSTTVMSTPAHSGSPKSRYSAVAEPMTSAQQDLLSEPQLQSFLATQS